MDVMRTCTLGILSDIHYAAAAEQARGHDYELRAIPNPRVRALAHFYRHYIWLREPLRKNHLLDQFLECGADFDYVIANGDYSCNTAFVGLSDDAACQSVPECVGKLRQRFGARLRANYGDHELGKITMFGGNGGMRLASWRRAREEVGLQPFWRLEIGSYVAAGVCVHARRLAGLRGRHAAGGTARMGTPAGRTPGGDSPRLRRLAARPAGVAVLP